MYIKINKYCGAVREESHHTLFRIRLTPFLVRHLSQTAVYAVTDGSLHSLLVCHVFVLVVGLSGACVGDVIL